MERITLSYGSGGKLTHSLIDGLFLKELGNPTLNEKLDSAILPTKSGRLAFTTDSYVVNPIIFPGGDIGKLAVCGTVNDLSVCGAKPLYISLGLIIEEGLELRILERIVKSIKDASTQSGVKVVTGDTKVVGKGQCDKIFINTSGIGEVYYKGLSGGSIKSGDVVIVNGPVGEHAASILSKREGIKFGSNISSDVAPVNALISKVLSASGSVRFMRDPTRGGVATTLNEIVKGQRYGICVNEEKVPVRNNVRQMCEMLGLDPLYLACEGRVLIIVPKKDEKKVLSAMRTDKIGREACTIGEVVADAPGRVYLHTVLGGKRVLDMMTGEQLPRIC